MPRVICWQLDCVHNIDGRCRSAEIEYDPNDGCLTMEPRVGLGAPLTSEEEEEEEGWEGRGIHVLGDDE